MIIAGTSIKGANGAEERGPFITLIEEQKVYLATPKKTFQYYCGPCHGDSANGKGIFFTIDLKPKPRDLTDVEYMAKLTDNYLQDFITKGSAAMEKSDLCPPWGNTLEEDRIKGIIAYLRSLTISKSKLEEKPATEKESKEKKAVRIAEGKQKGAPKAIIWSVLIISCFFLIFAAKNEWKKLARDKLL